MGDGISALPQQRSRRVLVLVVTASVLIPGVAHLRLGAVWDGLVYLAVVGLLSAAQFGAPFVEPTTRAAALLAGVAFGLGWLLSLVAARSAARLVSVRP